MSNETQNRYFDITALWDMNDEESGTWGEVITVAPGEDPEEVAKDVMCQVEENANRDSIQIVDCIEVADEINAILGQIPKEDAANILKKLQATFGS